jgi:ubiquinone/menaquinone biosynthesis C-methylase UbiE
MDFDSLAGRYRGSRARNYDKERVKLAKWASEQRIVGSFLAKLPQSSTVLDLPVGTGRFAAEYKMNGLRPTGMDVSPDMLAEAGAKARAQGLDMTLVEGDIRKIASPDNGFDAVICICFLNWVNEAGVRAALHELARVARSDMIVSVRYFAPWDDLALSSAGGLYQAAMQGLVRVYKTLQSGGQAIHEKQRIEAIFSDNKLRIEAVERVVPRKYGTDYFIYRLRKTA